MTSDQCICLTDEANITDLGGSYTTSEINGVGAGLLCIHCGACVAIKKTNESSFEDLEVYLEDAWVDHDGWQLTRHEKDLFRHGILNFAVYRINEPPDKDKFECNFR